MRAITWILLSLVAAGCATVPEGPVESGAPTRTKYAAVPGEAFLRGEGRTILCQEAKLELPLHLEADLFVVGDKVRRTQKAGVKYREAIGMARVKFAEGVEIREASRILVTFSDCDRISLSARGHVVFLDQTDRRVVRDATALVLEGDEAKFRGPAREETLK